MEITKRIHVKNSQSFYGCILEEWILLVAHEKLVSVDENQIPKGEMFVTSADFSLLEMLCPFCIDFPPLLLFIVSSMADS